MSRNSPPTTTPSGRSIARDLQELRRRRSSWRPAPPRSATRRSSARRARPCPAWEPSASSAPSALLALGALGLRRLDGLLAGCVLALAERELALPERRLLLLRLLSAPAVPARRRLVLALAERDSRFQNGGCFSFGCLRLLLGLAFFSFGALAAFGSLAAFASFGPRLTESSFFQKGVFARSTAAPGCSATGSGVGTTTAGATTAAGRARSAPRREPPLRARPAPAAPRRSACPRAPRSDRSWRSASRSRRSPPGSGATDAWSTPAAAGSAATGSTRRSDVRLLGGGLLVLLAQRELLLPDRARHG